MTQEQALLIGRRAKEWSQLKSGHSNDTTDSMLHIIYVHVIYYIIISTLINLSITNYVT